MIDLQATSELLKKRYSKGPSSGIFTDGGARPNPGKGGWGLVHVEENNLVFYKTGHEAESTNNRMELTALIEAFEYLAKMPSSQASKISVYTDSQLCVNTINQWAHAWKKSGWKRKTGEIKNLDLVKVLYELKQTTPCKELAWVPGHSGWLWNEVVDQLASSHFEE